MGCQPWLGLTGFQAKIVARAPKQRSLVFPTRRDGNKRWTLLEELLPVWTIRIALICMFVTFVLLLAKPTDAKPTDWSIDGSEEEAELCKRPKQQSHLEIASGVWLIGSFASLLHAIATMVLVHQGSHDAAVEHTAQQTEDLLGIAVGSGIYFNYVFVLVWLLDAFWWTAAPRSYRTRNRGWNWFVYGFLIFIAINGSIVFESGWIRWFSLGGAIVLGFLAKQRYQTVA